MSFDLKKHALDIMRKVHESQLEAAEENLRQEAIREKEAGIVPAHMVVQDNWQHAKTPWGLSQQYLDESLGGNQQLAMANGIKKGKYGYGHTTPPDRAKTQRDLLKAHTWAQEIGDLREMYNGLATYDLSVVIDFIELMGYEVNGY